jgi:TonB family protein
MKGTDNDIERYHKGTLSAKERHALEEKALSDPFLADALEGSGQVNVDEFAKDIGHLNSQIGRRQTLFTPLRIAAGVIILIAAGWVGLYVSDQTEAEKLTSAEVKPVPTEGPKESAAGDSSTPNKDELLSLRKTEQEKSEASRKETIRRSPVTGPSLASGGKPTSAPSEEAEMKEELTITEDVNVADVTSGASRSTDTLTTRAEQPSPVQSLAQSNDDRKARSTASALKKTDFVLSEEDKIQARSSDPAIVTGKVTLADDGLALPGVNVRVKGSATGTVTDLNGNYSLEINDPEAVLTFSFIGLQTQEVSRSNADKLDVKLAEDVSQLSEVVVTGKATPVDLSGEPVIRLAEPTGGLKAYDKYLEGNLRYPQQALDNNIKGRVSVQFTVSIDGSLGEFKVMRSLGYGCDEEVIRLVKDGPAWIPSTENNVPTESLVRVRMRFDPSKKK